MELEYPYQLVTFLDKRPSLGETVYYGPNGWYPQVAIKRRFKLVVISEDQAELELKKYLKTVKPFNIYSKQVVHPDGMPVDVIEIEKSKDLLDFYTGLTDSIKGFGISKFPEREGDNFFPHITAEYDGIPVIDPSQYVNRTFNVSDVWVLKDVVDSNSVVYAHYHIG